MSSLKFKLEIKKGDTHQLKTNINTFEELEAEVKKKINTKGLNYENYLIQYKDADGDLLVISDEDEFL